MLRIQYRMHPSISAWPSKFFYRNGLVNAPVVSNRRDPVSTFPWASHMRVAFVNVEASDARSSEHSSISNVGEAEMIAEIAGLDAAGTLATQAPEGPGVAPRLMPP